MTVHETYLKACEMARSLPEIRARLEFAKVSGDRKLQAELSVKISEILCEIGNMTEESGCLSS